MGIYGHKFDNLLLENNYNSLMVCNENKFTDALKNFVGSIKRVIVNTIDKINKLLDKHPDSKIAQGLKNLLTKFKGFLTRADKVNNKDDANKLKSEVDMSLEEFKKFNDELTGNAFYDTFKFSDLKDDAKDLLSKMQSKSGYKSIIVAYYKENSDADKKDKGYGYIVLHGWYQDEKTEDILKDGTYIKKIGFENIDSNLQAKFLESEDNYIIIDT